MNAFILSALLSVVSGADIDISKPGVCEAHGVQEGGELWSTIIYTRELPYWDLQKACEPVIDEKTKAVDGCAFYKTTEDGKRVTRIYWELFNDYAKIHEYCHAISMAEHTAGFKEKIKATGVK